MENEVLLATLKNALQIDIIEKISFENIKATLANRIDHLIHNNFDELINLLYKVDVNENKLKKLLKENADADAAGIIADLIIERQLQKIETRSEFRAANKKDENGDEEKW